jgi:hypothetical protein
MHTCIIISKMLILMHVKPAITYQYIQGLIKKFQDLLSENYNLLLMAKNI